MNYSSDAARLEVKGRRYDATRRRTQAARNRERVLDVAEEILLEHGYAETTVSAIARAAEVSTELIYDDSVARQVLSARSSGADCRAGSGTPETRSDAMSAGEPDAAVIIREWATLSAEVAPRVSPIMLLIRPRRQMIMIWSSFEEMAAQSSSE
jgi:AcrR family transcriptional regulator